MTNYNERLDEILQNHFRGYAARSFPEWCQDNASEIWDNSVEKAKQAITSLIKELVAEAKPLLKERTASTEFTTWDRKTKVVKTFESEADPGFNQAIKEFEQNLLKALSSSGKE